VDINVKAKLSEITLINHAAEENIVPTKGNSGKVIGKKKKILAKDDSH